MRIGLPLDGWDLAVVDADGLPVDAGRDRRADHRRRRAGALPRPGQGRREVRRRCRRWAGPAPTAAATWCGSTATGCVFQGRADDQVKLGGRRIELGEIDSALLRLPGVLGAAAAVRRTGRGQLAAGRLPQTSTRPSTWPRPSPGCGESLPAALVPRLAVVDVAPDATSGKVDRDALPWPLPGAAARPGPRQRPHARPSAGSPTLWLEVIGADVRLRRATTSSTSAAAASPRPRSCPGCAPGSPR